MSKDIDFSFQKELRRDITKLQQELERKQSILNKYRNEMPTLNLNEFEYLYFTDEFVLEKTKRAGFWLRCEKAQKIIYDLKDMYNIDGVLKLDKFSKTKMFSGLYLHYAEWLGEEYYKSAKIQIFEVLRKHSLELECYVTTYGDIATILGVI
jgi:hypothetical protein